MLRFALALALAPSLAAQESSAVFDAAVGLGRFDSEAIRYLLDFDGDGDKDGLALRTDNAYGRLNDGSGAFSAAWTLSTGTHDLTGYGAIEDFNDDGLEDFCVRTDLGFLVYTSAGTDTRRLRRIFAANVPSGISEGQRLSINRRVI